MTGGGGGGTAGSRDHRGHRSVPGMTRGLGPRDDRRHRWVPGLLPETGRSTQHSRCRSSEHQAEAPRPGHGAQERGAGPPRAPQPPQPPAGRAPHGARGRPSTRGASSAGPRAASPHPPGGGAWAPAPGPSVRERGRAGCGGAPEAGPGRGRRAARLPGGPGSIPRAGVRRGPPGPSGPRSGAPQAAPGTRARRPPRRHPLPATLRLAGHHGKPGAGRGGTSASVPERQRGPAPVAMGTRGGVADRGAGAGRGPGSGSRRGRGRPAHSGGHGSASGGAAGAGRPQAGGTRLGGTEPRAVPGPAETPALGAAVGAGPGSRGPERRSLLEELVPGRGDPQMIFGLLCTRCFFVDFGRITCNVFIKV